MNAAHKTSQHDIESPTKALVVGLGLTGYSIVRYLAPLNYRLTVADSRELPPYLYQVKSEFPQVEVITGAIPDQGLEQYDEIITSPGVGQETPRLPANVLPIGDIELFARQAKAPVIGITGSNGKSTVTMLVTEMLLASGLRVKTGGNIGTPALDLLEGEAPDFYVLELSSFQLETTYNLAPASAVVLNISEDHMDRYANLADYISAKVRIFNNSENIVVNRDDRNLGLVTPTNGSIVSFGLDHPPGDSDFGVTGPRDHRSIMLGTQVLAEEVVMTLKGDQNISNVLAAMALVKSAGVELGPGVVNAAMAYGGLPHRCEVVAEHNGVKWINDSKGTNVGATIAAIKGFKQRIILIAGGKGKGANFKPLVEVIASSVSFTILIGEDAQLISSGLSSSTDHAIVGSLDEAVSVAQSKAQQGDVVLFSPACASFDMFDNFEHRGNVFKNLVLERVH
jgi:UDP-N-acetylmuramoylalanine--D-glutamate ligase